MMINAYVQPLGEGYLDSVARRLPERGDTKDILLCPVSGPTAGVTAVATMAALGVELPTQGAKE